MIEIVKIWVCLFIPIPLGRVPIKFVKKSDQPENVNNINKAMETYLSAIYM